jgi:metal-responsive CopG/Arc/MetJ family transcriptional regulator
MKTVQVVLDERTLKAADREAKRENINRSALVRRAIALYVERAKEREQEERHRRGYAKQPILPGEFDAWDKVQTWPEK